MASAPLRPLVAIIGATGTGKSDLAVDVARNFNGEIINGDAMQLYRGLPIITNKIPEDEKKGITHHLLGRIGLEEETWTVGKFVQKALVVIDEIRSRGKLPILVGGTHYYTQSLLFQDALADAPLKAVNMAKPDLSILSEPTDVILKKLKEVDPVMADRWHPNERRKIQRSLEMFLKSGQPASQIYDKQRIKQNISSNEGAPGSNQPIKLGPTLRFPTLVLWVHASKDVLYPRLDNRITKMLNQGLLSEVEALNSFRASLEALTGTPIDQTRGIWVSIGYKQFLGYKSALNGGLAVDAELETLKMTAIEQTRSATRQYANRQIRWIRIKLLNALHNAGQKNNTFLLDGSDQATWEEKVLWPARDITERFISGSSLPSPTDLSTTSSEMLNPKRDYDLAQRPDLWQKRICEMCGIVAVTQHDWNLHLKSRRHRRAVKKQENAEHTQQEKVNGRQVDIADPALVLVP
ncbi:tRNA isopentenyltransferase [Lindgomyces ingoldianus]|uniref:tRNA isopentenyltransferase n=1 Tax=Lindgomyces ingoldianus TaxID=673940 RepID=A0ACB6R9E9_9PLEO|nr:tRNA isopentenyltransferase [Lindgomyces ingoldianus]KAF2475086.1 tRNA isopentenyltransferase [Lindgomyces ingoldianus]